MKFGYLILAAAFPVLSSANNDDLFNYGMGSSEENGDNSYGQNRWNRVSCDDLGECTGFPNWYPHGFGFSVDEDGNQCEWCPEGEGDDDCGIHRQSPIDLHRDRGELGGENEKECPDWHWIQYRDDTCTWDDMKDQFTIERHALQIHTPQLSNGEIDCYTEEKGRRYPRMDYSKGFPDWWWMQRTDIMVPSQHTQEGTHYAAEVHLAHFYELEHYKNALGHIAIFLQDYDDAESWAYLDKLICQWRIEEEKVREECNEDPAPPYGRCQLFRGQDPTDEWLAEATATADSPSASPIAAPSEPPTSSPTDGPTATPIGNPTDAPGEGDGYFGEGSEVTDAPVEAPTASPVTDTPVEAPTASVSPPTGGQTEGGAPSGMEPLEWPETHAPSSVPSDSPSSAPMSSLVDGADEPTVPPEIDCGSSKFDDINFVRMCSSNKACCEAERSTTSFCWESYDLLENMGASIASACYHCCAEPKIVGTPTPEKPGLPKEIQCSAVENPYRMCKEGSCCEEDRSSSQFCTAAYGRWTDNELEQICHYCCREPKTIGPARRNLRSGSDKEDSIPEGSRVLYSEGRKHVLGPENFDEEEEGEQQYFDRIYADHKRRNLQEGVHEENYDDIEWYPYEWMLKVGTEYYFRYEGSQVVPPCYDTVHWRPMKDPIRVHKRQIAELHRLLAWRLNPDTCDVDTAGVLSDDGNTIKANREIQYYHDTHRMVFCECKDWPSKFEGDKEWCKNWREDIDHARFYDRPYSFETNGKWHPDD